MRLVLGASFLAVAGTPAIAGSAATVPPPPALVDAAGRAEGVADCASYAHARTGDFVRRSFDFERVALAKFPPVYLAFGHDSCLDGAHDSMVLAFASSPSGTFRKALSTMGFAPKFAANGTATVDSRLSVAAITRTSYAFDGSTYRTTGANVIYLATGETKPALIPVHFAVGSAAATLAGKTYAGFPDTYEIRGTKGQTISVSVTPKRGKIGSLFVAPAPGGRGEIGSSSGAPVRGKLPSTGAYRIVVEGGNDDDTPTTYAMTIAIQ